MEACLSSRWEDRLSGRERACSALDLHHRHARRPGDYLPSEPEDADTHRAQHAAQIITPEQFDAIYQALPGADIQLFVETVIQSA
jgi:hypothetical protein